MENKNFRNLMEKVDSVGNYEQSLGKTQHSYLVKIYKVDRLKRQDIQDLYIALQKKFYNHKKRLNQDGWYENELRIFVWVFLAYLYVNQKNITDMNIQDWSYFSDIFNHKHQIFFHFQALSLLKTMDRPPAWSQQQEQLLKNIIRHTQNKNKWNFIARELFMRSNRLFFRNPKQCRQRWMNHLDPSKKRSEWTSEQDLTLLNCIRRKGKKWSLAVKQLKQTRTEHMVKNRYKSLISHQSKKYPAKKQSQVQNILIKKIHKIITQSNKNQDQQTVTEHIQSTDNQIIPEENTQINQKNKQISTEHSFTPTVEAMAPQRKLENQTQKLLKHEQLLFHSTLLPQSWKIDDVLHSQMWMEQSQQFHNDSSLYVCDVMECQLQFFLNI